MFHQSFLAFHYLTRTADYKNNSLWMAHLGFRTHEWISSWWFSAEMPNVVEKNQHVNSYNHACASGSFFTHWVRLHFEERVWCGNAALDDGGEKCWVKSWHVLWATRLAPPLTDVLPNMITTPLEGSNNPTCSLHRAILHIFNVIFLPNCQPISSRTISYFCLSCVLHSVWRCILGCWQLHALSPLTWH